MSKTVVVTGANGFIGAPLCDELERRGHSVRRVTRGQQPGTIGVGDIGAASDWSGVLAGADAVVHLAGLAHGRTPADESDDAGFRRVNVDGTLCLGRQASDAAVRRFIFVSSIGVHGDAAKPSAPFCESSPPHPNTEYARSKWEAEEALVGLGSSMELVVVRPPLVYGPHAPGNLARLRGLASKKMPLPLGGIDNKRSLIGLDNLVDFLAFCVDVPLKTSPERFVISDDHDVSTTELVRALFPDKRLVSVPTWMARVGSRLVGQQRLYRQLWESLTIDSTHARDDYGWKPPTATPDGLRRAAGR